MTLIRKGTYRGFAWMNADQMIWLRPLEVIELSSAMKQIG
jgi:hypothetical protein